MQVDRLERLLEGAGIKVWRDTKDLWPGEDWRLKIREAITNNAMVFVACFSHNSAARTTSYQNAELVTAVDEFRKRSPDQTWLIPVRFSDCTLPQFDLGAGRTLDSLQRVDLWGDAWDRGAGRFLTSVSRAFEVLNPAAPRHVAPVPPAESPAEYVKARLLDERRQIELDDYVRSLTERVVADLMDQHVFPTTSDRLGDDAEGARFLIAQVHSYRQRVANLIDILVAGCAWGREEHAGLWRRTIERIANTSGSESGQRALVDLRRYPTLLLLYAGAMAALDRDNYRALRSIAIDAQIRTHSGTLPLITSAHLSRPFPNEMTRQALAFDAEGEEITDSLIETVRSRRRGKRYTPISDHLYARLRRHLEAHLPDDGRYTDVFDRTEIVLAVLALDQKLVFDSSDVYVSGAWFGAFTWRDRYSSPSLEQRVFADAVVAGESSPLLQAGLFGGSRDRMERAFTAFISKAGAIRQERD